MNMMKTIIAQLIDDFHERKHPALVARHQKLVQIKRMSLSV